MAKRSPWQVWAGDVYHRIFRQGLGWSEIPQRRLRAFARECAPVTPLGAAAERLAVLVPCYGHARYLGDTVDSLCRQTRPPDEVILVNDCSPDDTLSWLHETGAARLGKCVGRVEILDQAANVGQARSINRAVEAATAPLLMVLNDDDYLCHDAIEIVMGLFARHPATALWGGSAVAFADPAVLRSYQASHRRQAPVSDDDLDLRPPDAVWRYRRFNDFNITHSGSTFRREAWRRAGGYRADPRQRIVRYTDRDFQLRIHALYPVGLLRPAQPLAFWRSDSSVDKDALS